MVNFMKQILATKRLFLREMGQEDYSDLSSLLQDRAVMYAYEHDFTAEDVQEWLDRQLRRYREDGYGLWAMILRETGEFIGQVGLTRQDAAGEEVLEIGYLLKHAFWHQGFASEATEASKEYAFQIMHAPKVCSIIKADNIASQKVAKGLGMKKVKEFKKTFYNGEMLHFLYEVKNKKQFPIKISRL